MSTQQIRLNINELVNSIKDEDKLKACYKFIITVVKDDAKQLKPSKTKAVKQKSTPANGVAKSNETDASKEKDMDMPHDLSLAFLANEIFKGNEPLPEAGEIAFEKAFKKSLKKQPTLPNRL